MNFLIIAIVSTLSLSFITSVSADEQKIIKLTAREKILLKGLPQYVTSLVKRIKASDMNRWLLSENMYTRWQIMRVRMIEDDLVLVDLSDGHGAESVLFDRDYYKKWKILTGRKL